MKYVAIHLQTGGLEPSTHSILEIGAIVEDTEKNLSYEEIPKFQTMVEHPVYHGEPYAFYSNRELFRQLILPEEQRTRKVIKYEKLAYTFFSWVKSHIFTRAVDYSNVVKFCYLEDGLAESVYHEAIVMNVAGKNFGVFQQKFLKEIPEYNKYIKMNYRIIDPSIFYLDIKNDEFMPGSEDCKKRAGITTEENITSNTLSECWDVISLLRKKLK